MEYHIALKFKHFDELLIKFNDNELTKDYIFLFHKNYQRELPLFRDQGAYSTQRMRELALECREILGWDWMHDQYNDFAITTAMHKDIERHLAKGFGSVPSYHDTLLHELHICLHSAQYNNQRTTIQLEWFNDDGFSLNDYDFEFIHDNTLGAIYLQNPYVGHPPDWVWRQNDYTNVWQTCRFHDFVRPGLVINMQGTINRSTVSFPQKEFLDWWTRFAPDFLEYHGKEKMLVNTGKPIIGYTINNRLLLELRNLSKIEFEYARFNPELEIKPAKQKFLPECNISRQDYENLAGPDWPEYDKFRLLIDVPDFVLTEIYETTGIKIQNNN